MQASSDNKNLFLLEKLTILEMTPFDTLFTKGTFIYQFQVISSPVKFE